MTIKAIAFDLDGTIYFGDRVAEGAIDTVNFFKDQGIKIIYFTNNSSSRRQVYLKLINMGFNLNISDVYTSGYACALFVRHLKFQNMYCLGSPGLKEELKDQGIGTLNEGNEVEAIIVGLDKDFDYERLATALNLWKTGVRVIACNRDRAYPIENGKIMPGCGAIVAALEAASGKTVDDVIGKPNTFMIDLVTRDLELDRNSILIVGDSEDSDIEMARKSGCPSVLISTKSQNNSSATKTINTLSELRNLIIVP